MEQFPRPVLGVEVEVVVVLVLTPSFDEEVETVADDEVALFAEPEASLEPTLELFASPELDAVDVAVEVAIVVEPPLEFAVDESDELAEAVLAALLVGAPDGVDVGVTPEVAVEPEPESEIEVDVAEPLPAPEPVSVPEAEPEPEVEASLEPEPVLLAVEVEFVFVSEVELLFELELEPEFELLLELELEFDELELELELVLACATFDEGRYAMLGKSDPETTITASMIFTIPLVALFVDRENVLNVFDILLFNIYFLRLFRIKM